MTGVDLHAARAEGTGPDLSLCAVIVIGRNEGARLRAALAQLAPLAAQGLRVVYVDSASHDGSAAMARGIGVAVVELDPARPMTAARGRNAGVAALAAEGPLPRYLQFIDGDCLLDPAWPAQAVAALEADPALGIVTGWRRESAPLANAYHAMTEVEWHQPAGEIRACGGDMMVRSALFESVRGFDASIIASEDEDFVQRVLKTGSRARRLPLPMTVHDIAMTSLGAWWRRNLRSGNGFAEVGGLHPPHFAAERKRALVYGVALPVAVLAALVAAFFVGQWIFWTVLAVVAALYLVTTLRVARWLSAPARDASLIIPPAMALRVAGLFTLSKVPQALGFLRFHLRGGRRGRIRLIEYK